MREQQRGTTWRQRQIWREREKERERHRTCVTERHIDRDIYREKQRGNWREREGGWGV